MWVSKMTLCIYHGNCADGFGAAWVVSQALDAVEFYPGVYQDPPPDVTGRDVVMVDFSYKRPVLLEMALSANSILILDHHKTAEFDLTDLPDNVTAIFDQSHSGSILTWNHFFPDKCPPQLLLYIEDRDLWKFELPSSREVNAAIFSFPYDFDTWNGMLATEVEVLANQGEAIERKHFKDVHELLGVVSREMNIGGYRVPVANLPYTMTSDAGHILATGKPFAACYWDTPNGRVFSLRSSDGGLDVSEIAKGYGGGGHMHAAGFRIPLDNLLAVGLA